MKDTHQTTRRAMLSNSSEALEACISPTSSPAENPWFKRPSSRPFKGSSHQDKITLSNWDAGPGKDAGVIRIGDAPCDTQGATEPEGFAKPSVHPGEDDFALSEKTPVCGSRMKQEHDVSRPAQANLPRCLDLSMGDSRSDDPLMRTKHSPRTFWRSSISETVRLGTGDPILPKPFHTPSQDQCNNDQALPTAEGTLNFVQRSQLFYHNNFLPGASSSVAPMPWNVEVDDLAQRKPSNLSEMERQRGPIKKRHYQPDVLDLSIKRPKSEIEGRSRLEDPRSCGSTKTMSNEAVNSAQELFQEQLHLSPKREQAHNFSSCAIEHPLPSERLLLAQESFQEQLSKALKQEQAQSTNKVARKKGIFVSEPGHDVLSMSGETDFVRVTNFDEKEGVMEASASFRSSKLGKQTSTNVSNSYSSGNLLVTVLPNTDIGRQWVLHVTQHNEMFAMHHLQAKLAPDSESNHSSMSDVSHQASMPSSLPFKIPLKSLMSISDSSKMEKPYACEHCSSRFKHRHHVIRHMRAHNGERPFHCEHCGATFARKCVLTNHRRTHTGEKPYICSECGDTFSRKHHLVIHQRTHSGEKPYQCLDCGAAFARSHHVNRHRKTHEKEQEIDAHIERLQSASAVETNIQLPTAAPLTGSDVSSSPKNKTTGNPDHKVCQPVENIAALIPNSNSQNYTD